MISNTKKIDKLKNSFFDMVNPDILISMESKPSELNSSGFKDGKDLTIYWGYVTYDFFSHVS